MCCGFSGRNVQDMQKLLCQFKHVLSIFFVYSCSAGVSAIITYPTHDRSPLM